MSPKISSTTRLLIIKTFRAEDVPEATRLLTDRCGNNIPFHGASDEFQLERVRFAVIKLSEGSLTNLITAVDVACEDWRDVLVAAGFGSSVESYKEWAEGILKT